MYSEGLKAEKQYMFILLVFFMILKNNGKEMNLSIVCSAMKVWFMEYHCGLEM
jgi:hypothetical protein